MEKLFGVPMNNIMIVMLVLLLLCFSAVIWVAITRRVIFRMGMRNIPRRKTQSLLIIIGLMLATLISTAALAVGDSLNYSVGNVVYSDLGEVDELVVKSNPGNDNEDASSANLEAMLSETLPGDAVDRVRAATDGLEVDAVGGVMLSAAPVINIGTDASTDMSNPAKLFETASASNPSVGIAAAEQQTFTDFRIKDIDGNEVNVDQLGKDKVYISKKLADDIDIGVGGKIVYVLNNQFYFAEVVGIVPNHILAGGLMPGSPSMIIGLDQFREATNRPEEWSVVAVSNSGNERTGVKHTDSVVEAINADLAQDGYGVNDIKKMNITQAELAGSVFTTMFIGFGLFSISVGVLLIVLIFTMLAAERRSEMGMMRAVGGQRRQLIQQFLSEGAGYTLLSGLVGVVLGLGAAWIVARGVQGMTGGMFDVSFYVHPRSLVVAYALGVIMTFAAVAFSSWRASRLNVVAAIRDIPEIQHRRASKRTLILAILGVILGAYFIYQGQTASQVTLFLIGMTLVPFSLAQVAIWWGANSKIVLSLAATLVLIVWGLPGEMFEKVFGEMGVGGIELFFLSGLSLVAASTVLIMQHLDFLLTIVEALGTRVKGWLAAVRLGVAYPQSNASRSGMTIAMFSLIVFSIVVMASVNNMVNKAFMGGNAMAGLDVELQMLSSNKIDDISAELEKSDVNMEGVSAPGQVQMLGTVLDQVQVEEDGKSVWKLHNGFQAVDNSWIDLTQLTFKDRAVGYDSDEAIREALKNEPNTVIIPDSLVKTDESSAVMIAGGDSVKLDIGRSDGKFEPYTLTVRGGSGEELKLKVIGVMSTDYSMLWGAYINTSTVESYAPGYTPAVTNYYFKLDDRSRAKEVAAGMEKALLQYGAQGTDIAAQLKEFQSQQSGFMTLLQWFMGLGLIVGVAAVGVISYRAVVERRQQIGVLRSLGFQSTTVGRAFVIETGIIVILGSLAGAILGLIISYSLTSDPAMTGGTPVAFEVPWTTLLTTMGMAIGMALLMSWLPARQASRVLPAEALRYE